MSTNREIILIVAISLLLSYMVYQDRKVRKLAEVTQNKETLSWVDYKGYHYDVEIHREVHSGTVR